MRCPTLAVVAVVVAMTGCAAGPRLSLDPTQAEFPFSGQPIVVDGRLGAREWDAARRIESTLPDGRTIGVLMQRDREHFQFAFTGLDQPAPRPVWPEILIDLWGNRSSTWDSNDWWIRIGELDCWARGGWGEGECRENQAGLEANNPPLARGEAVEVSVAFRELRFDESYDDEIGLAFRFVDDLGSQIAVWPLRAEVARPDTWAPISLNH